MGVQLTFPSERTVSYIEQEEFPLKEDEVRVRTLFSGISAGTELASYRGSSPHLTKTWDANARLFRSGGTEPAFPVEVVGYEEVGEIVEVGHASGLQVGQLVWGTWGHNSAATLKADFARQRLLAPSADPRIGIFSHIGAVALNAILDADIHVGETVVVFGLGVPGQIIAQLARLNGAHVIVVDGIAERRDLALRLGAEVALDPATADVAEQVRELTQGRGADAVIEATGNYRALHEAIRTVAYNSRVCVVGFFQGEGHGLSLGEEFHHNRVQLISSQISGQGPHVQHRWDRLRLNCTIIDLATTGTLDLISLITQTVPFAQAGETYRMLDSNPSAALQVVLEF